MNPIEGRHLRLEDAACARFAASTGMRFRAMVARENDAAARSPIERVAFLVDVGCLPGTESIPLGEATWRRVLAHTPDPVALTELLGVRVERTHRIDPRQFEIRYAAGDAVFVFELPRGIGPRGKGVKVKPEKVTKFVRALFGAANETGVLVGMVHDRPRGRR